ncbi:MAG: hypothetical protein D6824_01745 [Planctomycetota bacterium]|nr:MAG: hypothetical protein D6824_01745 [Planctomycetota bacterium]
MLGRTRSRPAPPRLLLGLSLAVGLFSSPAAAQQPDPSDRTVELAPTPHRVASLGLSIRPPLGARVQAQQLGQAEASLVVFAPDGSWRLLIREARTSDAALTPLKAAQELLKQLQAARAVRDARTNQIRGSSVQTLAEPQAMELAGLPAARFYAAVPKLNEAPVVSGYTLVQSAPGRFIVAELDCLLADYDRVRPVYEQVLDTLVVDDPAEAEAARAAVVLAGEQLLASLDQEALKALLPKAPLWWRHYVPAAGDAPERERGYQRIEVRIGQRGELDPRRPKARWSVEDREYGFLASAIGRFLDGERIVDSQSLFFLSFDRSREAWVVRMTVRQGDRRANWTETGVREGDDIKVTADQPGSTPLLKHWKKPPQAYLSQVEVYLLPRILASKGVEASFGFYRYVSALNDIALRRDTLTRLTDDAEAHWLLETRTSEDAGLTRMTLREDGSPLRRVLPDGSVMEPITLEALKALWRRKGLPLS